VTGDRRKSSFSHSSTDCVELTWRKSSRSGTESDCVELAWGNPADWRVSAACKTENCVTVHRTLTAVRDSKRGDAGPVLVLDEAGMRGLVARARAF
jgi:hypothetical protein